MEIPEIDHLDLDRLKNGKLFILKRIFQDLNLTFVSVFIVVNLLVIVFVIVVIVSVFLAVFRIVIVFVIIGILRLRFRPRIRGCYGRNSEYQKW